MICRLSLVRRAACLIALTLVTSVASAQTCLTTMFAADNGGSLGGAVYFDVDVVPSGGITVTTMQINTAELVGFDLTVYTTPTTYMGAEASMGLWTQVSTGMGTGQGRDNPTDVDVVDFVLPAGSQGLALVLSGTAGHDYTGTGAGGPLSVYMDANITITAGSALNSPFVGTPFSPRAWNGQICYELSDISCAINTPVSMDVVSAEVSIDYDADQVMMLPLTVTFEYSTDAGLTWLPCTPGMGYVNPLIGLVTPALGTQFGWDSVADGVGLVTPQVTDIRLTFNDGVSTRFCAVDVTVDNVVPSPTCTLILNAVSPASDLIPFDLTADILSGSMTVDALFEYSIDGGLTYMIASPSMASANPILGVLSMTPTAFEWDSRGDGVGIAMLQGMVQMRATLTDVAAPTPGECTTAPFEVDNTALCQALCGDCDGNGMGPGITDALTAAQIGAGLIVPTPQQMACCDIDASLSVNVLDALGTAQAAAGLPGMLTCP